MKRRGCCQSFPFTTYTSLLQQLSLELIVTGFLLEGDSGDWSNTLHPCCSRVTSRIPSQDHAGGRRLFSPRAVKDVSSSWRCSGLELFWELPKKMGRTGGGSAPPDEADSRRGSAGPSVQQRASGCSLTKHHLLSSPQTPGKHQRSYQ